MAILSNFQANGQEAIKVAPPSQSGTLTYNGSAQSPTWTEYPTTVITVTSTAQTNAGTYNAVATLTSGHVWSDTLKGGQRNIPWTIGPATGGTIVLSKSAVELEEGGSETVSVTATGATDTITVVSSNSAVATVRVSGRNIVISDGGTEGTATITVSASGNYSYASSKSMSVEVSYGPKIVLWSTGTDAEIAAMVAAADAGELNLSDYWNIGDERTISLSAMSATYVNESHVAQTAIMVLVAKATKYSDKYNPCWNYQYVTPTSARTYPSFIVQLKDTLKETGYINSTNYPSSGGMGWKRSDRRSWCNNTFRNAIPNNLRPIFKQVQVKAASQGGSYGGIEASEDYFFLPAEYEVCDSGNKCTDVEINNLCPWSNYASQSKRVKTNAWFTRSPWKISETQFCSFAANGSVLGTAVTSNCGICPAGCI